MIGAKIYFSFFNIQHNIFIACFEIPYNTTQSLSLPSLSRSTAHSCDFPERRGGNKTKNKNKSSLCCLYTHLSLVKLTMTSPIKTTTTTTTKPESFPTALAVRSHINCKGQHIRTSITSFKSKDLHLISWLLRQFEDEL